MRREPMPSAEITSYKPTSHYYSGKSRSIASVLPANREVGPGRPLGHPNACDFGVTWVIILLKAFVTKWVVLHIRP